MEVLLEMGEDTHRLLEWRFPSLEANANAPGPVIRFPLPRAKEGVMRLVLKVQGRPELDSDYSLMFGQEAEEKVAEAVLMNM